MATHFVVHIFTRVVNNCGTHKVFGYTCAVIEHCIHLAIAILKISSNSTRVVVTNRWEIFAIFAVGLLLRKYYL